MQKNKNRALKTESDFPAVPSVFNLLFLTPKTTLTVD
jgi:hypothetical protein